MSASRALAGGVQRAIDALYIAPLRRFIKPHIFRYGVCGVLNYIILDPTLYFLLYNFVVAKRYLDLGFVVVAPHTLSLVILFPIIMLTGFWLNRNVAFEAREQRASRQLMLYIGSIAGSLLISYSVLKFLVEVVHLWATPAKVVSSVVTSLYSYLAARYITFKR